MRKLDVVSQQLEPFQSERLETLLENSVAIAALAPLADTVLKANAASNKRDLVSDNFLVRRIFNSIYFTIGNAQTWCSVSAASAFSIRGTRTGGAAYS
jgi:hypothetical protein